MRDESPIDNTSIIESAGSEKTVARGSGLTFLLRIVGRSIWFGFQILLTRTLSAEIYGIYSIAHSVLHMGHRLSSTGPMHAVVRFVSEHAAEEDWPKARGAIRIGMLLAGGVGLIITLLLLGFSNTLGTQLFNSAAAGTAIAVLGLSLPFYNLLLVLSGAARAVGRVGLGVALYDLIHPLLILIVAGVVIALFRPDLLFVLYAFLGATILVVAWGTWRVRSCMPKGQGLEAKRQVGGMARYSALASLSGIGFLVMARADRLMIGMYIDPSAVGIYSAAALIAFQLTLGMKAIEATFAPQIVRLHRSGQSDELASLYTRTTKWIVAVTIPVILLLFLYGKAVLGLFGTEFQAGYLAMIVLTIGQFSRAAIGCADQLLLMTGHQRLEAINGVALMAGNITLNILLIPRFKIVGAAIATGSTLVLMSLFRLIQVKWTLKLLPFERTIWKPIAAGLVAAAIGYAMTLLGMRARWELVLGTVAIGVSYVGALAAFGLDEDYLEALRLLRKKFGGRVK